jgi:crotonobetainyl-CoA:carnitine CoA-transferase CaiB-like acyl-CoA transferase
VLDFSRVLSGPVCGRALADLGADVIKVEPPQGDLTRFANPKVNSLALYFTQQNSGKRNISLDLARPEATTLLQRLAAHVDVVLENFRPGVMERLGLGYDALAASNPRLVYASITGFGQDGPWANRRAYAVVTHAEVGVTAGVVAHRHGQPPMNDPYSHGDLYAGLHTLAAILAALYQRERTGRGQHVDVSMAQALLAVNEYVAQDLSGIDEPDLVLALAPGFSPVLETASGRAFTVAGHPCGFGVFERYCRATGRADLLDDPRFGTVADRLAHYDELIGELRAWAATIENLDAVEAAFASEELAVGVVRTVRELAATDWAAERGAFAEVDDRGGASVRVPQAPWRFSDARAEVAGPPAYRGEHNREVLGELLGLDAAELDRLAAAGVLSSRIPDSAR